MSDAIAKHQNADVGRIVAGAPVAAGKSREDESQTIEVEIAVEMLDSIENLARDKLGDRSMSIPPEMVLILISVYREYLSSHLQPAANALADLSMNMDPEEFSAALDAGEAKDSALAGYEPHCILAVVEAAHNVCMAAEAADGVSPLDGPLHDLHDALTDLEAVDGMGSGPVYSAREIMRAARPSPGAEVDMLKAALRDLLPYAVPNPTDEGGMTIRERAARLLGGQCADCGGTPDDHVANYYCAEFRLVVSPAGERWKDKIIAELEPLLQPPELKGPTHGAWDRGYFEGRKTVAADIIKLLSAAPSVDKV